MADDAPDKDSDEANGPLAGERLAAARKDQDISIRDIAKELHLDEAKVQALEQNQFDVLGAPVFAKGHLRKYAELVGVSEADVLADYYELNRSVGAPPVVGPPRKAARDIDLSPYILPAVVVVVILGLLFWWLQSGSPVPGAGDGTDDTAVPAEPESNPEVTVPDAQAEPAPVVDAADDDGSAESANVEPAVTEPDTTPNAAPDSTADSSAERARSPVPAGDDGALALTLQFSGDCWTEVTDGAGDRLFFDLGKEGRTVEVSGEPPLRLLLGNSNNVSVSVNGDPYAVPASARRGDTARFTIAGL
ncbi:MAG: RodZ domain-containing protein [Pseudomonadota bacterium]